MLEVSRLLRYASINSSLWFTFFSSQWYYCKEEKNCFKYTYKLLEQLDLIPFSNWLEIKLCWKKFSLFILRFFFSLYIYLRPFVLSSYSKWEKPIKFSYKWSWIMNFSFNWVNENFIKTSCNNFFWEILFTLF